jgi:hypothetical protein
MPFCQKCGKHADDVGASFCQYCGAPLHQSSDLKVFQVTKEPTVQKSGGGIGSVVAVLFLVIIIIGAFLFLAQPHGSSNSLLQCFPHQETVYVGYVNTLTQQYQFTTSNKVTSFSYAQGAVLYTVHLIDDQGNHYDYHYVTGFNLTPTTITTGC